MSCLVFILTDEHPEGRSYITNPGLNILFGQALALESPTLRGIHIRDCNEFIAVENLFDALTTQALMFEEICQDTNAVQTAEFANMDVP